MNKDTILSFGSLIIVCIIAIAGFNAINNNSSQSQATIQALQEQNQVTVKTLLDKIEVQSKEELGGLVNVFQEINPEGIWIGKEGGWQIKTDSDDNLLIATSTNTADASFYISSTGVVTIGNVDFVTSTLNYTGDFNVRKGSQTLFFVDNSTGHVGIGTTTPKYQLENASSSTSTVAITAVPASGETVDPQLRFNIGANTLKWMQYVDDSDSDKFKIATSTDTILSVLSINSKGRISIDRDAGGLFITSSTQSGVFVGQGAVELGSTLGVGSTLSVTGAATLSSTLTVAGESNLDTVIHGGDITSITTASTSPTAAQICDSRVIRWSLAAGGSDDQQDVVYFASSSNLIADCLTTVGDEKPNVLFHNYSTSTYKLIIRELNSGSDKLEVLRPATTTGATSAHNAPEEFILEAGEYMSCSFLHLTDSATTTVICIPMMEVD